VGVKNLVRVLALFVRLASRITGSDSEVGPKPEEGHYGSVRTECLRCEDREVDAENHEAGVAKPMWH
jgi:hypothetical protein